MSFSPEFFSNKFVKLAITSSLIASLTMGNTSCAPAAEPIPTTVNIPSSTGVFPKTETSTTPTPPEAQNGKQYLLQAISELQSSPIKDMLNRRVSPFLQNPPSKSYNVKGIDIPVQDFNVKFQKTIGQDIVTDGRFINRPNLNAPSLTTTNDTYIYAPYLNLYRQTDNYTKYYASPDKTSCYVLIKIGKGSRIYAGIAPEISVITSSDIIKGKPEDVGRLKEIETIEKAVGIKESISFAIAQVTEELIAGEMSKIDQPLSLETTVNNSASQVQLISTTALCLMINNGRFTATMDAAASVIMIKAYPPEKVKQIFEKDPEFSKIVAALAGVDLGHDDRTILLTAINWVLTNPLGKTIPHDGNFDKIP